MSEIKETMTYKEYLNLLYQKDISSFWLTEQSKRGMYEYYYYSTILNNEIFAQNIVLGKN